MAKSAFQVIAEFDQQIGSPGLVRTMQVLKEQMYDLDDELFDAYEDFRNEIAQFAKDFTQQKVVI